MMKSLCSLCFLLIIVSWANAQSIVGKWKSIDDEDGKAKSYINIYEQEGQFFGDITELLDADNDSLCDKCKGANKDQPIVGMTILWDMVSESQKWEGGRILDPKSGKDYSCILELENKNKLKVRGYIGTPFIGRTQYWYKVEE